MATKQPPRARNQFDSLFYRLKSQPGYTRFAAKNSIDWYKRKIKELGGVKPGDVLNDKTLTGNLKTTELIGKLFFYEYDAKWKDTLPYWDRFPLVIPIERYDDGFLGLNLHYLEPRLRVALFANLLDFATNDKFNANTKIIMSYRLLKGVAKYRLFKPCVHRYLTNHIRSRFVKINADNWEIAVHLPLAEFQKQSEYTVWKESRQKAGLF
jgi:hypothetical protein